MTDLYNMTDLQNADTFQKLFVVANDATGQILVGMFLIVIFILLTLILKRSSFKEGLLASSFVCFILSIFLRFANLISFEFVIGFLLIMALTGLYMHFDPN
jgi:hypothetical protein